MAGITIFQQVSPFKEIYEEVFSLIDSSVYYSEYNSIYFTVRKRLSNPLVGTAEGVLDDHINSYEWK
jgi:hypothetical protein